MAATQEIIDEFVGNAHGDFNRVKELLDAHPEILNADASWHETAIEAAAQTANRDVMDFLLARGAPMSICTAAALGRIDLVRRMLDEDPALVHATGAHGIPLIYHAALAGDLEIVRLLVERGAQAGGEGPASALEGAVQRDDSDIAAFLIAHGANVNAKNYEGKSMLTLARELGNTEVVNLLAQNGAS